MQTITITAPIKDGEVAVFKLKPLVDFNDFADSVDLIESIECVKDGEEVGIWEIV